MSKLGERDRQFFALVARAAFANPFGSERAQLDAAIGETDERDPHVLARVGSRLDTRLSSLRQRGELSLSSYQGADRELLFPALMFDVFHRYLDELDRNIAQPGKLRFARRLLGELTSAGISAEQARRALELFHQLRRAHLAIGKRLLGLGPSMRKLREELWNSVFTHDILRYERFLWSRMEDFSTLLVGEMGSGKGEAARAIGSSGYIPFDETRGEFSQVGDALFVPVNLSEYPETLIESELFGHKRGAFTGAIDHHTGAFARVPAQGTLFLDEIGEVSASVQVKLLRVLQERSFTPVGGHEPRSFEGRVVAATHRSLSALRQAGRLRDDFYFRIATHTIEVPSLRTRLRESPSELALLVDHICTRISGEHAPTLSASVCEQIERELGRDYPYEGNVRELEQCVRRVLLTGHARASESAPGAVTSPPLWQQLERGELDAEGLLRGYCALLYQREKSYVQVAKIAKLDRRTVRRYLRERP